MQGEQGLVWTMQPYSAAWAPAHGVSQLPQTPAWLGPSRQHQHETHAGHVLVLVFGESWAALQTFTCSVETPGQGMRGLLEGQGQSKGARQMCDSRIRPPACLQLPDPTAPGQEQRQQGNACLQLMGSSLIIISYGTCLEFR